MAFVSTTQQLVGFNTSGNIADALAARLKDPLWMLARQWQTGEFEAENGGRPTFLSIMSREVLIDTINHGGTSEKVSPDTPLDFVVERETNDGASTAWNSEALEYTFAASGDGTALVATEYHGRNLDWYHFDVASRETPTQSIETVETRMVPTQLTFRGAPHPRWWRFEDGDAYFDSPFDPEPNALSMLLPEFFFIDINNWYIAPLLQTAGTIREIQSLEVVDSFGVVTPVGPSSSLSDPDWSMYSLAPGAAGAPATGDAFLYIPNIAVEVLDNDQVEEVMFTRDEEANLVWANERFITLPDGTTVRNGDGSAPEPPEPSHDPRPRFVLRSDLPRHFIPYVPRFLRVTATTGETYLRRGRTIESRDGGPQYRSRIVAEAWRLNEAEVPRSGVRVRRTHRYARGSDGRGYFWIGRDKQTAPRSNAPGQRFDFLQEPSP